MAAEEKRCDRSAGGVPATYRTLGPAPPGLPWPGDVDGKSPPPQLLGVYDPGEL